MTASRHRGVSWHAQSGKWRVRGYKDGAKYGLGLFVDEDDSGHAYDGWAVDHHREFAWLNFPDERTAE